MDANLEKIKREVMDANQTKADANLKKTTAKIDVNMKNNKTKRNDSQVGRQTR
jgi:hypothetical protein